MLGLGIGFVLAGLFVLVEQAFVAAELQPLIGTAAGAAGPTGDGFTPYGSLSYLVYAIGIGLIGTGAGIVRMTFHTSLAGYAAGGVGAGAMGMSPEAMQALMASSQAAMTRMAAPGPTTVKVKCPHCGSLEEEDAKFCHKCGQAMQSASAASVYGVGPTTASKILAKMDETDKEFFNDLFEAKLKCVTARPYWNEPQAKPKLY